jgi:Tfp pilus assembly protein PilV
MPTFERILFEAVMVLSIGVLALIGLSVYNMHVIDQQRDLIRQMQSNPKCMNTPAGSHV